MCAQQTPAKKKWLSPASLYALMILLGIFSGYSDIPFLKASGLFIADVFIKIFKCISLPIIALSIIVTLSNYRADGAMKTVWRRAMTYTLGTTLIAAAISCLLYLLIQPNMVGVVKAGVMTPKASGLGYFEHIANLIPSSIWSPFLEHQVMGVLLLGIVVGIAIRFIPEPEARHTITQFFRGAHGLFMVITNWIITIIPIGLFGFITTTVVQLRGGITIKGISQYLLIIVLANLIQGLIVLPLWLKSQGIKPFAALKGMMPALSVAFFSKSSVGTLPITMETAEKNLQVKPEVSRFVLPLCTSLNMNGCAAFIFTTVIYLMQNHGLVITVPMMLLWVIIATIAAIGNAGVPMGCFFLSASLLASMNIPITLLGIILPFYSLIDMLETALNVWSDSCVAKVVNDKVENAGQVSERTPAVSLS
ncbi:dicarboxylate/amino acid:cation symporter [Legionella jordanis]|uniref:Na /H-dicarboxylate symporter n=1 Tax=Legionella jordanis TaxID=456 RepID=A0A0W0V8V3_9GAMM|nr:dicarboxylate/amino acid:cation symporter [Legionella jordanis]KTD16310.1 Na /H -dicarboxylate symporter [Legionella jordanis]RMX04477.1 dicarboxylate/amino acid:cation symporter [Legionella jordanis]RMX21022.1 dicarboxylate/amino acid:cation symporter [Legionella jordanis]VEH12232.1 Na /H -dicarboxylate symporter [Legionella jordanis]HAT8713442.1 cation:dicarboxylase symporter family transporter [Legionella jordanis]